MIITIFGTGSPNEEGYREAYELGKMIARAGHMLKNGGYGGTMEAAAKGCLEDGGKTIGICIKGHKIADAGKPNAFLSEIIIKENLTERLRELLNTDMIIILKGKIGTLEEFFHAWAENLVKSSESANPIPIFLIGEKNKMLLDFLIRNDFINSEQLKHIVHLNSIDDLKF